jgi:hypothetical protein
MAATKTTRRSAPGALQTVVTRFPNTPAAELAKEKLAELGADSPSRPATPAASAAPALRTWTDSTGQFTIEAELVKVEGGKVELKQKDGQHVAILVEKLSKEDQEFLAERK